MSKKKLRENNDQINLKKGGRKQDYKQKSIKYHSQ